MFAFIRRHLDPSVRLGEILFALIMALGFTASVRLGLGEADHRELFVGILGCNVAWAIIDAALYVMTELFERGRAARLVRDVHAARSQDAALALVSTEMDERMPFVAGDPGRDDLARRILAIVQQASPVDVRIRRSDLLSAGAVALVIVVATLPVVAPFLVFASANIAVRVSNGVSVSMLFLLGVAWGRSVGRNPLRIGALLAGAGIVLVLIAVALGG
ncbi:MAG TPA: VIT family protein [Candidatus Binatia bacterium]